MDVHKKKNMIKTIANIVGGVGDNADTGLIKHFLVLPILCALGYDVFSTNEVTLDASSANNMGGRADFRVRSESGERFYVMVVPLKAFSVAARQLNAYFQGNNSEEKIAVVTDGRSYEFYTDTQKKNIIDGKPYYSLEIDDLDDDDVSFLFTLSYECFATHDHKHFAVEQVLADVAPLAHEYVKKEKADIAIDLAIDETVLCEHGFKDKDDAILHAANLYNENPHKYRKKPLESLENSSRKRDKQRGVGNGLRLFGKEWSVPDKKKGEKSNPSKDKSAATEERDPSRVPEDVVFHLKSTTGDYHGLMKVLNGKCVILEGSVLAAEIKTEGKSYKKTAPRTKKIREENAKAIEEKDGKLVARYDFNPIDHSSPAGQVVNGGSCNGWSEWKDESGKTLHEYAVASY